MLQSQFVPYLLRLDDNLEHALLKGDVATGTDLPRLENIHAKLAERDSIANEERQLANARAVSGPEAIESAAPSAPITAQEKQPATASLTFSSPAQAFVFEEAGPYDGYYYYYHPLTFRSECRSVICDSCLRQIVRFRRLTHFACFEFRCLTAMLGFGAHGAIPF